MEKKFFVVLDFKECLSYIKLSFVDCVVGFMRGYLSFKCDSRDFLFVVKWYCFMDVVGIRMLVLLV